MFMNFMDYVDDASKYMFTPDQAFRVQTAMANSPYRKFLGTHNLCNVQTIPAVSQFNMQSSICGTETPINITNMSSGVPVPSFTWSATGGASFFPNANSSYASVSFTAPGLYTITLSTSNGTLSTSSRTINVIPRPNIQFSSPSTTVCMNDVLNVTASGGNSYTWYPGNIFGATITYVATSDITYTCFASGGSNCNSSDSISFKVAECTGVEQKTGVNSFRIYPNPGSGQLFVSHPQLKAETQVLISDALGREVLNTKIQAGESDTLVDASILPAGIYTVRFSANGESVTMKLVRTR